jgi:hypothetical protein
MNPLAAHHLLAKIEKLNMKEEKETMSKFLSAVVVEK